MDKDSLFEKIMPIVDELTMLRLKKRYAHPFGKEWDMLTDMYRKLSDELTEIIVSENMASVAHKVGVKPH